MSRTDSLGPDYDEEKAELLKDPDSYEVESSSTRLSNGLAERDDDAEEAEQHVEGASSEGLTAQQEHAQRLRLVGWMVVNTLATIAIVSSQHR